MKLTRFRAPQIQVVKPMLRQNTITALPTSNCCFFGKASKGSLSEPQLIRSYTKYTRIYGRPTLKSTLGYSIELFFKNGGTKTWVMRTASEDANSIQRYLQLAKKVPFLNYLLWPGLSNPSAVNKILKHCEKMNCFYLFDVPENTPLSALLNTNRSSLPNISYMGACYFPWVQIENPDKPQTHLSVPPSAIVAGLYSKTGRQKGIWKAPAGMSPLSGIFALNQALSDADVEALNGSGINCLKTIPRIGHVVWGARTFMSHNQQGFKDLKYVSTVRLKLWIQATLIHNLGWVLNEPNTNALWVRVHTVITNWFGDLYRDGAFQGSSSKKAFYVKCGLGTTMTQKDIQDKTLKIQYGFAPLKPSEFIVNQIELKTN